MVKKRKITKRKVTKKSKIKSNSSTKEEVFGLVDYNYYRKLGSLIPIFSQNPADQPFEVEDLLLQTISFLRDKKHSLVYGESGTGKTSLAMFLSKYSECKNMLTKYLQENSPSMKITNNDISLEQFRIIYIPLDKFCQATSEFIKNIDAEKEFLEPSTYDLVDGKVVGE